MAGGLLLVSLLFRVFQRLFSSVSVLFPQQVLEFTDKKPYSLCSVLTAALFSGPFPPPRNSQFDRSQIQTNGSLGLMTYRSSFSPV